MTNKKDNRFLGVFLLMVAAVGALYLLTQWWPMTYGEVYQISHEGGGLLTCYVDQYDDGRAFTIGPYLYKILPQTGILYSGRCYCAENYLTQYVDIQAGACSNPSLKRICGTLSPTIYLDCAGGSPTTTTTPETYCQRQGWLDSQPAGMTCEQVLLGGYGGVCYKNCVAAASCTPNAHRVIERRCDGAYAFLKEQLCYSDGSGWTDVLTSNVYCSRGCLDGVCIPPTTTTTTPQGDYCTDSDQGMNYYTPGSIDYKFDHERGTRSDRCSGQWLSEFYCLGDGTGAWGESQTYCDAGCETGACVSGYQPQACYDKCTGPSGSVCNWQGQCFRCDDGSWTEIQCTPDEGIPAWVFVAGGIGVILLLVIILRN